MVVQASDRVAALIDRDERLLEALVEASPEFERLRNPLTRRVMGRLVTVEQAARIARIDPEQLVTRLNQVLEPLPGTTRQPLPEVEGGLHAPAPGGESAAMPPALSALPAERITDLDVRDALRRGEEPFSQIMAAKAALPPDGVLRLRAIFEPAPLYAVLGKQGFAHWTEQLADDDWRVWFYRADSVEALPATAPAGEEQAQDDGVVVLDVRGLEPPEPMMRTLAALEELPPGKTLVQLNVRTPQFLLPKLAERGFTYEVHEQSSDLVRVFIRRTNAA